MCKCCRSLLLTCLSTLNKSEYKCMFLAFFSFMLLLYPQVLPKNLSSWSHISINRLERTACYFFQATNLFGERSGWYEFPGLFSLSLTLKERGKEGERERRKATLSSERLSLILCSSGKTVWHSLQWKAYGFMPLWKGTECLQWWRQIFFNGSLSGF